MKRWFADPILLFLLFSSACYAKIELQLNKIDPTHYSATLSLPAQQKRGVYQDSIALSVNSPDVTLSDWQASIEPSMQYDPTFKTDKNLYCQPFKLAFNLQTNSEAAQPSSLFVTFQQQGAGHIVHEKFELSFDEPTIETVPAQTEQSSTIKQVESKPLGLSACIEGMIESSDSIILRILLALCLGLLLSLTPCIYPMIPITMGILQSQGTNSMGRNFLLALTYTLGIATTFALLGVGAAFTGKMFGSFMSNPFVILCIVALMVYLAGSMIGWYDLHIPSFLQPKNNQLKNSSFLSIFLFGAASGTVASPCLSPGLLLLLTIVTTLGSYVLGFLLLFAFGFGLGIPLLIIGTFSSSLNVLPRAGMWMVHIKRFFGFVMLGTCLYFIQCLVSESLLAWLTALYVFFIGAFYIYYGQKEHGISRTIQSLLGGLLVATSVYCAFLAFKTTTQAYNENSSVWLHDYNQALALAHKEHKKILLDISAPYCSICKAIDKKIFADTKVIRALNQLVPVKIEDIEADETTLALKDKFHVMGAPTIVLYDPEQDTELTRWGSELYDTAIETFLQGLSA